MIDPAFGSSDETLLTIYFGNNMQWPVYWSHGNIDSTIGLKPLNLGTSLLPFFLVHRNITSSNSEQQLPWRRNQSTIEMLKGRCSILFLVVRTNFSTVDNVCFVLMIGCGYVILSSVDAWLTTLETFTSTPSRSPIALWGKHHTRHVWMAIHDRSNV